MKKLFKVMAGVLLCAVVLVSAKVDVFATQTANAHSWPAGDDWNNHYSLTGWTIYNDTPNPIWFGYSGTYGNTFYIYTTSAHGGTYTAPFSLCSSGVGTNARYNMNTNEAYGFWVTLKYGNGEADNERYQYIYNTDASHLVTQPENPTWEGYVFVGWYTDSDYTTKFDFTTPISADTALYGRWYDPSQDITLPFKAAVPTVDRDLYKTEMPSKTIVVINKTWEEDIMDMKLHATAEANVNNQKFLVKQLLGEDAKIVCTWDVFPRRDLSITENGDKRFLVWNNLDIKTTGVVKAVVYNEADGAYIIYGVSDGKGSVKFDDFIYRPASTISLIAP